MLFLVPPGVSNVRITGLRIEGPDWGPGDREGNRGIQIVSATNVTVANNEIYGWRLAGIQVLDIDGVMESPPPDDTDLSQPYTVQILDNFIHHNQAIGGDGYGVFVGHGAHALIARNVFDWNRHAITGDGREGTGYAATHNLVLENGGLHRWIPFPGFWTYTHQFDMHGRDHCGVASIWSDAQYNCGPAGHTVLIRRNTFFFNNDHSIKLRGTPAVGMFVGSNVFAWDFAASFAMTQTESGLVEEPGNIYGYNGKQTLGTCDFDGDSVNDSFMATGQTWWYRSGTTGPWEFMNASTKILAELELGFFDADNRCDVFADGTIFPGGRAPSPRRPPRNLPTFPVFGITP